MTPERVIAALDRLTPNSYDMDQKLSWLDRVESELASEIFFCLINRPQIGEELLVPEPYDELYLRYLQAQIYLEAGEITRYNNAIALYNNAVAGLRRDRIRRSPTQQPHWRNF